MGLVIENTYEWEPERLAAVFPSVRALIQRLVAEFPNEVTEEYLLGEAMVGNKHLWVVYDDAEPNRAVIVGFTEMDGNRATGRRVMKYTGLCGDRLAEVLPDIVKAFEAWGRERGAQDAMVVGRRGWEKTLKNYGYHKTSVILKRQFGDDHDTG